MSAAHEAFILMDPVQDWEESDILYGVFGSLEAAKVRARKVQADRRDFEKKRRLAVQHWVGPDHVATWEFLPEGEYRRPKGWSRLENP